MNRLNFTFSGRWLLLLAAVLLLLLGAGSVAPAAGSVAPAAGSAEGSLSGAGVQAEWHVCPAGPPVCDLTTIQEAVDAAGPGDVIKVAFGLYSDLHFRSAPPGYNGPSSIPQVVYISKTVSLQGGYDPTDWSNPDPSLISVIDAMGAGRGLVIAGVISPTVTGFYITGGNATGLGGGAWPYEGTGGGLYVVSATVTLSNNQIYSNVASLTGWGGGGGLYLYDSDGIVAHNHFFSNTAGFSSTMMSEGGAIVIAGGYPILKGNGFFQNAGNDQGLGIGGALYMEDCAPTLKKNIFWKNQASRQGSGHGGAVFVGFYSSPVWENNVFVDNLSGLGPDSGGSAIFVEYANPTFYHTTIHDNIGGNDSGIEAVFQSNLTLVNTILTSQTLGITLTYDSGATLDGILWFGNGANTGGAGTFTITNESTGDPRLAFDGYHLLTGSAAIDVGVPTAVPEDIDGQARPYGAGPDIGADEWHPCIGLTDAAISGPTEGTPSTPYPFTAVLSPSDATFPITYTWSPPPAQGQGTPTATYSWPVSGTHVITLTAANCGGSAVATHTIVITGTTPVCPVPLEEVAIFGPDVGFVEIPQPFAAAIWPLTATLPITYTWTPQPDQGQGSAVAFYTWPATGTYTVTVTAENCGGSAFTLHFITIQEQITLPLDPGLSGTLVYTDPYGQPTIIDIPAGAVSESVVLAFVPRYTPTHPISPGMGFAGHAFDLDAYRNGAPISGFAFLRPVTVTVGYSEGDVGGVAEDSLGLYYWDGAGWADGANTCAPPSVYLRDLPGNRLTVAICHLSRWSLIGSIPPAYPVYLPVVFKGAP